MQEFKALANMLADEAGEIVRHYFRTPFDVISKSDASPVTIADRAIEQRLRDIIEDKRPQDGIFGEEFGIKQSQNGLTWVLDPIDGTKSFVIGRPTFGTLIALCEDEKPVLGVIDQGVTNERWLGVKGEQTLYNGEGIKTRACKELANACCGSTTPAMFSGLPRVYETFDKQTKMMAWGGDCYMYGLLARGFMDVCFEANLSPYDFAALVPVVQGAGGKIAGWDGQELTLQSVGRVLACGDADLWDQASKLLKI
jgi:histidinol phosphatase-like enzyme (inositol monophosphatase family)